MSTVSNEPGLSSFNEAAGVNSAGGLGNNQQLAGSSVSSEKFRRMSPAPAPASNANFDNFVPSAQGGDGGGKVGGEAQDVIRHSQAKLAVLEDMIAKERRRQSVLSNMDNGPTTEL